MTTNLFMFGTIITMGDKILLLEFSKQMGRQKAWLGQQNKVANRKRKEYRRKTTGGTKLCHVPPPQMSFKLNAFMPLKIQKIRIILVIL